MNYQLKKYRTPKNESSLRIKMFVGCVICAIEYWEEKFGVLGGHFVSLVNFDLS